MLRPCLLGPGRGLLAGGKPSDGGRIGLGVSGVVIREVLPAVDVANDRLSVCPDVLRNGKRKPMAAYRFGGLAGTLFRPGESGLMSMIG